MKKIIKTIIGLSLLPHFAFAFATTSVPWVATTTGFITPSTINGNSPYLLIKSTGTSSISHGIVSPCFATSTASPCLSSVSGGGSGTVLTGLTGQVPYYASNGITLSPTSTLFLLNQNVGIGTTTPNFPLVVIGTTTASCFSVDNGATCVGTSGMGTVTSVDMTTPIGLSVSGNPITTSGTLALALTTGYNIPLTASTTNWNNFFDTPSTRITAGTNLSWSGNTLNNIFSISTSSINYWVIGSGFLRTATTTDGARAAFFTATSTTATSTFANTVGIGTSTPSGDNKLEVNGNGYFSGNLTGANLLATGTLTVLGASSLQGLTFTIGTGTSATTTNSSSVNATTSTSTITVLSLKKALLDSIGSPGTNGNILQGTGTSTLWVATSSLGLLGSSTLNSLTNNTIPKYQSSNGVLINSLLTDNGTSVGVSTSSPSASNKLEVSGAGYFSGPLTSGNLTATGTLTVLGTASSTFAGSINSNSGNLTLQSNSTTNSILLNAYGGSVGVGTSSPASSLSVSGGSILAAENVPATSTSMTINWLTANQEDVKIGTAGVTISFSNVIAGGTKRVIICNPPSGTPGAITWPTSVLWSGGTIPTGTATTKKCDVFSFLATTATSSSASVPQVFGSSNLNF